VEKRRNGTKALGVSAWASLTFSAVRTVEMTPWKDLGDPTARMARGSTEEEALRSMEHKAIFYYLLKKREAVRVLQ
jgi:hypothetical protein